MTLDLYGHLVSDQLDDIANRLDQAARDGESAPDGDIHADESSTDRSLPRDAEYCRE